MRSTAVLFVGCALVSASKLALAEPEAARRAEERAVQLGRHGQWAAAVGELDRAVELAPGWAEARYLRGVALIEWVHHVPSPADATQARATLQRLETALDDFAIYLRDDARSSYAANLRPIVVAVEVERDSAREQVERAQQDEAEHERQAQQRREEQAQLEVAEQQRTYDDKVGSVLARRHAGYVLVGISAVLGGVSYYFYDRKRDAIADISAGGYATSSGIEQRADDANASTAVMLGSGAVAGVAFAIGLPLILSSLHLPERPVTVTASSHAISITVKL